ncbi:23S rRNA (uracil(1939)-C(5))-methyltransferase RlmD [Candidatus Woesearchaeota archaeon]|nr:23S rRNA (uracil(1939)-C(5))-methyltransferase RlmD [Candidatus Woesearchaeota archaeon]
MATPKCPYFGTCGGCTLQNLSKEEQAGKKLNAVKLLLESRGINAPTSIASANEYEYRNRMDFVFCDEGVGLRERENWNKLVQIKQCAISNTKLNKILTELWTWSLREKPDAFKLKSKAGTFKYAVIRAPQNTQDSCVTIILNKNSSKIEDAKKLIQLFAKTTTAHSINIGYVEDANDVSVSDELESVKGEKTFTEKLLDKTFTYSSQAFAQNNTRMAEEMIKHVQMIVDKDDKPTDLLIDLYGGAGTFGISLAHLFKETIVIDNNEENIKSALHNIKLNKVKADARFADAKALSEYKERNYTLIVDPPRAGMHPSVLREIVRQLPKEIVYISCNPLKMAEELAILKNQYLIESVKLFDLFPQTEHVEAIAHLRLA